MPKKCVAFQGIPGSFSFIAMREYLEKKKIDGFSPQGLGQTNFKDIFRALTKGDSELAIVPLENSLAGSVYEIYDLLLEFDCHVIGEHYLHISHNLAGLSDLSKIKKVFSHPKAIEQCRIFFENHPELEKSVFSDTAGAAKFVAESKDSALAAICGQEAAALYGLKIIKPSLEDDKHNYTRFLVLSREVSADPAADKCSVIFTLPHTPQSLIKALGVLSDPKINISKIQSRPIHGKPFEYVFYIDFEFANEDLSFARDKLSEFKTQVNLLKNLGFYKKALL